MSEAAPSSCAWVRNNCRVPCMRWSYSMPVAARSATMQSRLYSASRTIRPLLTA